MLRSYEGTRIVRLSQTLVLKGGINARPCEANVLELVVGALPVPRVHRVVNVETEDSYYGCQCMLVMDFVEGRSVEECWERLTEVTLGYILKDSRLRR